MTEILKNLKYDERDGKFIKVREEFYQELKKNFACDNYDEIIKYIFEEVFNRKLSQEEAKTEFESLFSDKTDELVKFLYSTIDAVYNGKEDKEKDVLDKILSNDSKRKQKNEKYSNFGKNRRKSSRDYYNNRKDKNEYRHYQNRKNPKTTKMKIGNKEITLHSQKRSRSRSYEQEEYEGEKYQKYDDYQNYPNMYPRGYYPQDDPRMFPNQMVRGGFQFYPPMIGMFRR